MIKERKEGGEPVVYHPTFFPFPKHAFSTPRAENHRLWKSVRAVCSSGHLGGSGKVPLGNVDRKTSATVHVP